MSTAECTSTVSEQLNGATRLFAIVGDPIEQVRSPEMFNALFASLGFDGVLVPVHAPVEDFDAVVTGLKRMRNLDGIVVTVPHKIAAMRHVDRLLPTAEQVRAVNAMARDPDGRWAGEMFDGQGFLAGLIAEGCAPQGRRVFLAGIGGVGRAIAYALAAAGVASLTLRDTAPGRAEALARTLASSHPGLRVDIAEDCSAACDLAVNATPLGMRANDPLPFDVDRLGRSAWVAEVVMKPDLTPLVAAARARGHPVVLGRRVLENQLRPMARFFGVPA